MQGPRAYAIVTVVPLARSCRNYKVWWPRIRHKHMQDRPIRRDDREAEGARLLSECRVIQLYRGFESLSLRHI
ncbi:hypothetical protein DFAR_1300003 [Desulfarculales bacterium]